jgi:hypothetical protein
VLKFARARGYSAPFDRDEEALRLAASAPVAAAHAPRFLGRCVVDGHHISVESAAPGARLSALLRSGVSRKRKVDAVETVAAWLLDMMRETGVGTAGREVERLARDVLPTWPAGSLSESVLVELGALPAVLQHNDMGSWNVVFYRHRGFTALDWESSRAEGLPLWDMLYFLADALTLIDGSADEPEGFSRLFRGEAPSSPLLFRWVRRCVEALAIPKPLVGMIATTCWLHHGLSRIPRAEALGTYGAAPPAGAWRAETYALSWLSDPALGEGWRAWDV